jgi:hypothetical protein
LVLKFSDLDGPISKIFVDDTDFSQFIRTAKQLNYSLTPEVIEKTRLELPSAPKSNQPEVKPQTPPAPAELPIDEANGENLTAQIQAAKSAWNAIKSNEQRANDSKQAIAKLMSLLESEEEKKESLEKQQQEAEANLKQVAAESEKLATEAALVEAEAKERDEAFKEFEEKAVQSASEAGRLAAEAVQKIAEADKKKGDVPEAIPVSPIATKARHGRYPVSATQLRNVFGVEELEQIALSAATHAEMGAGGKPEYHNVRAFLGEELDKAWRMLARAEKTTHYRPWETECVGLANAIRLEEDLTTRRAQYRHNLKGHSQLTEVIFEALGWAILVDSALLDLQIADDIERVAAEHGNLHTGGYMPHFWGAQPTPDAVSLFRDYVACKWPIHVFAIDPVTQDQNVADSFSSRREIQLTLSVALASGQINAQEYLQYARRLETELDTIALNRTVVGFSHGTDTFGWRFQPRIQTPPTPSNARVFFNEMLIGGPSRDAGMRTSMLEAGTRECVAVVLMPSILTQVNVDFRSSWYRLDKPHSRKFDLEDSVSLGQEVVELQNLCQQCFKDKSKYRHGDVWRLEKAVNQLEKQLPLQNSIVQVPNENSLGGTQLFEGGQTSLGPELIGFYGEPGVHQKSDNTDVSETTLFLVGRNFSVTGTKVIAAGQALGTDKIVVISRNVLQVTIPAIREDKIEDREDVGKVIDLHVATPYGVSHHLQIPVAPDAAAKKKADAAAAKKKADAAAAKAEAEAEADAAKEAIKTAVTAHVEAAHTADPLITWKTGTAAKTSGKITFGKDSKVKAFVFDNSGKTELKLQAPESYQQRTAFDPDSKVSLANIEVAFWVIAYEDEDVTKEIGRKAAGIIEGSKLTSYDAIAPTIEKALKDMVELKNSSEIKSLKVSAFVRRTGAKAAYQVPEELTVEVQTETEQLAIAVPADAAAAN